MRLLAALVSALMNQSWQPLEGALGEAGGGIWLLALTALVLLFLLFAALVLAFAAAYRRRMRRAVAEYGRRISAPPDAAPARID